MSHSPEKPQPVLTDLTRPFWTAARDGRLVMQKCAKCGAVNFLPKPWCVECGSRDLAWTEMKTTGTVYSYTISYSVAMNLPGWQTELPIVLGLVDIDEAARMYAQITDVEPDEVHIGMHVEAHFEQIGDEAGMVKFRRSRPDSPA